MTATAVITATYEHPKDGRRTLSFAATDETLCQQLAALAPLVPPATWTAKPGEDVTGHAR